MSQISKPVVEIFPPVLTTFTKQSEAFMSHGHVCPHCNGKREVLGKQLSPGDYDSETCPVCKGTGSLKARITIQWMAENLTESS